jgi:hypothetical protein
MVAVASGNQTKTESSVEIPKNKEAAPDAKMPIVPKRYVIGMEPAAWTVLSYKKIAANVVSFSKSEIDIKVLKSSGPLVYALPEPRKVRDFRVLGTLRGQKALETTEFDEDSVLRFGLVGVGQQTLSGVQKMFAAEWVKKLFALAPSGAGLDKVYFFNTTNRRSLIGKGRVYPKSDLLLEKFVTLIDREGKFEMDVKVDPPIETAAIWLGINGDLANSEFDITLQEISLNLN